MARAKERWRDGGIGEGIDGKPVGEFLGQLGSEREEWRDGGMDDGRWLVR